MMILTIKEAPVLGGGAPLPSRPSRTGAFIYATPRIASLGKLEAGSIPAVSANLPRTLNPAGHSNSGGTLTCRQGRVGAFFPGEKAGHARPILGGMGAHPSGFKSHPPTNFGSVPISPLAFSGYDAAWVAESERTGASAACGPAFSKRLYALDRTKSRPAPVMGLDKGRGRKDIEIPRRVVPLN